MITIKMDPNYVRCSMLGVSIENIINEVNKIIVLQENLIITANCESWRTFYDNWTAFVKMSIPSAFY